MRKIIAALVVFQISIAISVMGHEPPALADIEYRNACGPISAYAAVRWHGIDTTLKQVVSGCGYTDGNPIAMKSVFEYLQRSLGDFTVRATRLSPDQLYERLSSGETAIVSLEVENSDVLHSVFLYGAEQGHVIGIDYPELHFQVRIDKFESVWSGDVILMRPRQRFLLIAAVGGLAFFVSFLALTVLIKGIKRQGNLNIQQAMMAIAVLTSCVSLVDTAAANDELASVGTTCEASGEFSDSVLTRLSYDVGLRGRGESIVIEFHLSNQKDELCSVKDVSQECGCFSLQSSSKSIEPNQVGTFTTRLSTSALAGDFEREIVVTVEFQKSRQQKSVVLRVLGSVKGIWFVPSHLDLSSDQEAEKHGAMVYLYQSGFADTSQWRLVAGDPAQLTVAKVEADKADPGLGQFSNDARGGMRVGAFWIEPKGQATESAEISSFVRIIGPSDKDHAPVLRVVGSLSAAYAISPKRLMLGRIRANTVASFELDLGVKNNLKLADVTATSPDVSIKIKEVVLTPKGMRCVIEVEPSNDRRVVNSKVFVSIRGSHVASVPVLAILGT